MGRLRRQCVLLVRRYRCDDIFDAGDVRERSNLALAARLAYETYGRANADLGKRHLFMTPSARS